jgi:hypothetical protein
MDELSMPATSDETPVDRASWAADDGIVRASFIGTPDCPLLAWPLVSRPDGRKGSIAPILPGERGLCGARPWPCRGICVPQYGGPAEWKILNAGERVGRLWEEFSRSGEDRNRSLLPRSNGLAENT